MRSAKSGSNLKTCVHKLSKGFTICSLLVIGSCDNEPDNKNVPKGGGNGSSAANLVFGKASLVASDLGGSSLVQTAVVPEDCEFSLDIYRAEGSCITPSSFIGYAGVLTGVAEGKFSHQAARLAATFNYHQSENGKIQSGLEVDFSDNSKFSAYHELWDQYEIKDVYKYAGLTLSYEKVKFEINTKFITMLLTAYSQPFTEWDEAFEGCNISDEQKTQSRYTEADLLAGLKFQRGDYLFCVKDSADAVCDPTDFKWLDLDTQTLVAERPANPRTHQFLVNNKPSCQEEGEGRYNFSFSSINIGGVFETPFRLYADYSHGGESVQWPNSKTPFVAVSEDENLDERSEDDYIDPWLIYYYQTEGATDTSSGTILDVTFDFGMEDLLYFDGLRANEIASASLENLLSKVYTKHNWYFQKKGEDNLVSFEVKDYAHFNIKTTISVSGGTEKPQAESD